MHLSSNTQASALSLSSVLNIFFADCNFRDGLSLRVSLPAMRHSYSLIVSEVDWMCVIVQATKRMGASRFESECRLSALPNIQESMRYVFRCKLPRSTVVATHTIPKRTKRTSCTAAVCFSELYLHLPAQHERPPAHHENPFRAKKCAHFQLEIRTPNM